MKKVSIIGTVGLPACYGGFETLAGNLVDDIGSDIEYTVYCSSKSYDIKNSRYKGAKLIYLPLSANGVQSVLYDIVSLMHTLVTRPNVILILGVSGCIFLPLLRCFSKAHIVTNIDGLEWRRDKWSRFAKNFLKFSERLAVNFSDSIISDNQAIADYVLEEYDIISTVIAYGGDHAVNNDNNDNNDNINNRFSLALCRIEPENNVEMILTAFSRTNSLLKFVGNWESSDFGRKMKARFSTFNNLELIDPIYDINELSLIRSSCSFYVHGHSAGGTNPSLVEMMHFGKPIVCFDCVYNRASTENKAVFFKNENDLVKIINSELSSDLGSSMLELAQRRYTWSIVRNQYKSTFIS